LTRPTSMPSRLPWCGFRNGSHRACGSWIARA
jgi:hypothetical protein